MAPQPRFIRLRDAPTYLGMDRHSFNLHVRSYLTEIPIGKRGIGFDRLDLDAYADYTSGLLGVLQRGNPYGKTTHKENATTLPRSYQTR